MGKTEVPMAVPPERAQKTFAAVHSGDEGLTIDSKDIQCGDLVTLNGRLIGTVAAIYTDTLGKNTIKSVSVQVSHKSLTHSEFVQIPLKKERPPKATRYSIALERGA